MFTFSSFFKRTLFLLSLGLLIPLSSEAAWYEAFGRAAVLDNDVDGARKAAVNDAVRNTLLEAGANIKVYQNYENGTLSSESMEINSDYPVKKVTVLEEQRTLNAVQVRVRVYIDDENISRCTRGMNPHQHRFIRPEGPFYQRDMFEPVTLLAERNQTEMPVMGRQIDLHAILHD